MSCSEQSAFHGQAADPVWFFSELLFQSVAAKKKKKKKAQGSSKQRHAAQRPALASAQRGMGKCCDAWLIHVCVERGIAFA